MRVHAQMYIAELRSETQLAADVFWGGHRLAYDQAGARNDLVIDVYLRSEKILSLSLCVVPAS